MRHTGIVVCLILLTSLACGTATPPANSLRNPATGSVTANSIEISITSITRPADDLVRSGSLFNKEPEAGQEYIQVDVLLRCGGPEDTACDLFLEDAFALVSPSTGDVYVAEIFVIDVPGAIETGRWLSGTVKEGAVFFVVDAALDEYVLRYEVDFIDDEYVYLALP